MKIGLKKKFINTLIQFNMKNRKKIKVMIYKGKLIANKSIYAAILHTMQECQENKSTRGPQSREGGANC